MAKDGLSPVFAHAMWRTGSTYLASRFAASDRYMLFYEPFHEGVGRRPSPARDRDRRRDRQLRHPEIEGGYFGAYEQRDPTSARALTGLFPPEVALRGVYNDATEQTATYLAALARCAQAAGKPAYLGFCRAGMQAPSAQALLGGRGLHLWRDARAQFASYGWPENDYFLAGTLLQLAGSRRYACLARKLAPAAFASPLFAAALALPDRYARMKYRIARRVARPLDANTSYAVFYLSWLISYEAGRRVSSCSFSLSELAEDSVCRLAVERAFDITMDDLRPTPVQLVTGPEYDRVEALVREQLAASTDWPLRLPA